MIENKLFLRNGNGIMEIVLFLPFAFLFLFSSIDLGLAYKDRGAILGAVNSALNEEVLYNKKYPLYSLNESADLLRNEENFQFYLKEINQIIAKKIAATRGLSNFDKINSFQLIATIVELKINPTNGNLEDYQVSQPLALYSQESNNTNNIKDFIDNELQNCKTDNVCNYALPFSKSLNFNIPKNYLPYSLLLAFEIKAESYGISKEMNQSLLGKIFSVDEKFLKLLRIQLN